MDLGNFSWISLPSETYSLFGTLKDVLYMTMTPAYSKSARARSQNNSIINVSINSMGAHPPPGRLSGICHFGEKMLQMPHHRVQIMQQNPHPWGLTLTQMPHPWGQNISFLRIFEPKTRMHALSRINITVFKIDSVAISFQNVLIKILKSQNLI